MDKIVRKIGMYWRDIKSSTWGLVRSQGQNANYTNMHQYHRCMVNIWILSVLEKSDTRTCVIR